MPDLARMLESDASPTAVISDAGSTKGRLVKEMRGIFGSRYIGSHPMAGSEKSGIEAATAELFDGATCVVTPVGDEDPANISRLERLWSSLGCKLLTLSPETHDALVARASHLPHAIAAALVTSLIENCHEAFDVTGSGFADTTRIAAGPAAMWAGIFANNQDQVVAAIDEMSSELSKLRSMVAATKTDQLEAYLQEASSKRLQLS